MDEVANLGTSQSSSLRTEVMTLLGTDSHSSPLHRLPTINFQPMVSGGFGINLLLKWVPDVRVAQLSALGSSHVRDLILAAGHPLSNLYPIFTLFKPSPVRNGSTSKPIFNCQTNLRPHLSMASGAALRNFCLAVPEAPQFR